MFVPLALHVFLLVGIFLLQRQMFPLLLTGTLVNSVFVISLLTHHDFWSYSLAVLVPALSLLTGHLTPDLNRMIPFISFGNAVLVYLYSSIADVPNGDQTDVFLRVIVPSFTKAVLIVSGGFLLLMHGDLKDMSRKRLLFIMAIQFVTSVAGVLMGENIARKYLI
jgi:hypothetical protein